VIVTQESIKSIILRRRSAFVAAAVAAVATVSVGGAGCCDPCLKVAEPEADGGVPAEPAACLKVEGHHDTKNTQPAPSASTPSGASSE